MKKELIGIFICMLLVGTVLPVTGDVLVEKTPLSLTNGNILYVGSSGEGNYTTIQDALNVSEDGYTIFVYNDSSPYYESLTIKKEITLLGEDKETTIIDGLKNFTTIISVSADWVTISGFTIQNCKPSAGLQCVGIRVQKGDHINISDNIIRNNSHEYAYTAGIVIKGSKNDYSDIINNIFINNSVGIEFVLTKPFTSIKNNTFINHIQAIRMVHGGEFVNSSITGNIIDKCRYEGIEFYGSNCIISGNTILNKTDYFRYNTAIFIRGSNNQIIDNFLFNTNIGIELIGDNNIISGNTISKQECYGKIFDKAAICLMGSNNQIINNNLFSNGRNAICISSIRKNLWDGNYWDDWIGVKYQQLDFLPYIGRYLFWFIIDWHPASEPYDIEV